jgi:hypothetical protein
MAIKKKLSLVDNFDILVDIGESYIRVEQVDASKLKATAVVSFNSDGADKTFTTKLYDFQPDLAGKNFIAQAYEHLKTLPEFSGAIDC